MNQPAKTLAELVTDWVAAKRVEDVAIEARRAVGTAIAEAMRSTAKTEGTVSQKIDGLKVVVEYSLNRKADDAKLTADWATLPPDVQACFKWKPEVKTGELKKLAGANVAAAAVYITTTPATPSVKVELA